MKQRQLKDSVQRSENEILDDHFAQVIDLEDDNIDSLEELSKSIQIEKTPKVAKRVVAKIKKAKIKKAIQKKTKKIVLKPSMKIEVVKKLRNPIAEEIIKKLLKRSFKKIVSKEYSRRKEVVIKKATLPALADLKGSLANMIAIKKAIIKIEADELVARKIANIRRITKLPQITKAQKANKIKEDTKVENVKIIKKEISKPVAVKAPSQDEKLAALLNDGTVDVDELDTDYEFANSTIVGIKFDYDKMAREKRYGSLRAKIAKSIPVIKKAPVKKVRLALNVPLKNEKKFKLSDERQKVKEEKNELIAKLNVVASKKAPLNGANTTNKASIKTNGKIINAKTIIDTIIKEKGLAPVALNQKSKVDLNSSVVKKHNKPRSTIIASGKIRNILKQDIDLIKDDTKVGPEAAKTGSKVSKPKADASGKGSQLLASNSNTLFSKTRRNFSVSGEINLPKNNGEYPRGYGHIYNFEALNSAGYPAGYAEGRKLHKFEISKNGKSKFIINDIKEGTRLNLVAEFFSVKDEDYETKNPKDFYGVTQKKIRSTIIDANIKGVKIRFPRLVKASRSSRKGYTGRVEVPFKRENEVVTKDGAKAQANSFDLKNAEVRIIGTGQNSFTDEKGQFAFAKLPAASGLSYEVFGRGLYPAVFSTCSKNGLTFPLFTNNEVVRINKIANENNVIQSEDRGIIIGKVRSGSKGEGGIIADLSELDADGPFYFNDKNELDFTLKATSSNGMFVYFNVPEGLQIIGPRRNRTELSGSVLDVYADTIAYTDINIDETLSFEVVVKNAMPAEGQKPAVSNAKITIIGAPGSSYTTDKSGKAQIGSARSIRNINTIEVEKAGFEVSRVSGCFSNSKIEVFVFPKNGMDEIKQELRNVNINYNPKLGMAMGSLMRGGELTIDVPDADNSTIVYFDKDGKPRTDLQKTSKIDGNFIILNLPVGQRNVIAYDKNGNVKKYFTIRSGGSIINSIISK